MTETAKLIVIAAIFFFLAIESWAAILEVLPHFGTDYILDGKFIWNTVASMKMLPGTKHALSEGLGVAERWKDFLGEHGADEYRKAIHDLKAQTVAGDNRYYANLGKKFRRFLSPQNRQPALPVVEAHKQYTKILQSMPSSR